MQDDDIVEFLDDEEVPSSQLQFDLAAMNFGSSLKTQSAKKAAGAAPSAKASLLSGGDGFDRSGAATPVGSAPPSGISTPSKASTKMGKRIDVVTEYQKRVAEKESLNLVVIGEKL